MLRLSRLSPSFPRQGSVQEALQILSRTRRPSDSALSTEFDVLLAELELETGRPDEARLLATKVLDVRSVSAQISARARRVRATTCFYAGQIEESGEELRAAKILCGRDPANAGLLAHLELLSFSLASRVDPLDAVFSLVPAVRRAVARAGNAHLFVLLRIAVARAETRRNGSAEARRHLDTAFDLVAAHPNIWLEGLLHVDGSAGAI